MSASPASRLFRQTTISESLGVYLPAMFAYRLMGFARGPILAWLMTKQEFGIFNVALLIVNVLNPLCSLAVSEGIGRYVPMYETRGMLRAFLGRAIPLAVIISSAACTLLFVSAGPVGVKLFATFGADDSVVLTREACAALTRLVAGTTLGLILYYVLLHTLKGLRMFVAFSVIELLSNGGFAVAAITVAYAGWATAEAVLWCCLGAVVLAALLFAPLLRRHLPRDTAHEDSLTGPRVARQVLRFSSWLAVAAILGHSLQTYPVWYLNKIHGPDVTGVFAAVRHLTQAVLLFAVAVATVVTAGVNKAWEAEGRTAATDKLLLAMKACGVLMLTGCAVYAALAPWLMRVIYPGAYYYGTATFPLTLLFFLVGSFLAFLNIHFHLIERTRQILIPWSAGVLANVIVGYLFIRTGQSPVAAVVAAGWAGIAAVTAALVAFVVILKLDDCRVDRGAWLLIAASYGLLLPTSLMLSLCAAVVLFSAGTTWIFTGKEKEILRGKASGVWGLIRQRLHRA